MKHRIVSIHKKNMQKPKKKTHSNTKAKPKPSSIQYRIKQFAAIENYFLNYFGFKIIWLQQISTRTQKPF